VTEVAHIGRAAAAPYLGTPSMSMREAMQRMSVLTHPFQVILDAAGRLVGTLTDGDIRRALLRRDVTPDTPVSECMHQGPFAGAAGDIGGNLCKLWSTGGLIAFLPVTDAEGVLVEILVGRAAPQIPAAALIMAGGYGRRLGERTQNTPKPLLPVAGRAILDRILDGLEAAGVRRVFLSVHYLSDQFRAFVAQRGGVPPIELIAEETPLGTAGAIAMLPEEVPGPILVMNGDVLTRVDLQALVALHNRSGSDATIAVARHEVEIPFGVVRHGEDGTFLGIDEKPRVAHFVSAGIYLMSQQFRALVPPRNRMDMPDLLNLGRSLGLRVGLFPIHEYWRDIGRPADLAAAEDDHDDPVISRELAGSRL